MEAPDSPVIAQSENRLGWLILAGTGAMTYLTFAKELVLYQNERFGWPMLIYRVATRAYYPLLAINLLVLLVVAWIYFKQRRQSVILLAAFLTFLLNVVLFSSNNILNILENKPVHRRHQGIGR